MKGFAEVDLTKANDALGNYDKLTEELRAVSKEVSIIVEKEVQGWGRLAKWLYLKEDKYRLAFIERYSDGWADPWTVFHDKGLIDKEMLCTYNKHTNYNNKINAKAVRELVGATTSDSINVGDELTGWINTYTRLIEHEQ